MKLSELSYREYLAIEFLPAFLRHASVLGNSEIEIAENSAKFAFLYADAFLRVAGRELDKIAAAEARAERSDNAHQVLRDTLKDMLEKDQSPADTVSALRALFGVSAP